MPIQTFKAVKILEIADWDRNDVSEIVELENDDFEKETSFQAVLPEW